MPHSGFIVQEILSGRRRGFAAGLLRAILLLASLPYRFVVALRNLLYDRGLCAVHRINRKVVSVGNLTTGGTGKTPLVEYVAGYYGRSGRKVVVISRGYAAEAGETSDEERLLAENLPGVPHVAGRDRVACAFEARRDYGADCIVMDDGFQHRRLARDLDIVAVDATNPFGFDHCLPRGILRESPRSLARAHVVVITRSALVTPDELDRLEKRLTLLAPDALIAHAVEDVRAVVDMTGAAHAADSLRDRRAALFCGIGNPEAFRRLAVMALGVRIAACLVFADHQRYSDKHLWAVDAVAADADAGVILTTQKDRVKLRAGFQWHRPVFVVKIAMRMTKNEAEFKRKLDGVFREEPVA